MNLLSKADELFAFYDANNDGVISRGEFVLVVETLIGEKGQGVSNPYFLEADRNSDNKISYSEFLELLKKIDWI